MPSTRLWRRARRLHVVAAAVVVEAVQFIHRLGLVDRRCVVGADFANFRDILIEDVWHSVDSLSEINVMTTQLGTGNHTIWVRAVSSEGISAPVTVALNIGDAVYSETEDSPSLPFGFVIFTSMMVALYKNRRID